MFSLNIWMISLGKPLLFDDVLDEALLNKSDFSISFIFPLISLELSWEKDFSFSKAGMLIDKTDNSLVLYDNIDNIKKSSNKYW